MTREQYFGLKEELKEMSKKIRQNKLDFKTAEREYSGFINENGTFNDYYHNSNGKKWSDYDKWAIDVRPFTKKVSDCRRELYLSDTYRYLHIIYGLARKKTLQQIENKNTEGNQADISRIKSLLKKYDLEVDL